LPSDGVPYGVFVMCALIPWQLFQYSLTHSSNSLVNSQHLVKKVYFPRLVIPVAAVLDGLVDFGVSCALLVAMMAFYGITPTVNIVFLPLFVLFATIAALSVGIWFSALNVQYRDIKYTVPFVTQIWMYTTPVAYSAALVPAEWSWLYGLNPMVGVVEGFRWALLGKSAALGSSVYVSFVAVVVILVTGLAYFRRMEASFADVI
jgi:lipopolysaccharide transport system permease protein